MHKIHTSRQTVFVKNTNPITPNLKSQSTTVVAVGDFNPAIFQPYWYSSMGLIGKKVAESSSIQVVHKDVADFSTDWFGLQVLHDRFSRIASVALLASSNKFQFGNFPGLFHRHI